MLRMKFLFLAILSIFMTFTGCDSRRPAEVKPAAPDTGNGTETTVKSVGNVQVEAIFEWPGQALEGVRPVKVTIQNQGERPVRVRYDYFSLVEENGEYHAAIPLYGLEGTDARLAWRYEVINNPLFESEGFAIAPYLSSIYPGIPPYQDTFHHSIEYYEAYKNAFPRGLPSADMYLRGLPEGVVQPRGRVSGYVFFEPLDPSLDMAFFRYLLVNAQNGDIFGFISFPVSVDTVR